MVAWQMCQGGALLTFTSERTTLMRLLDPYNETLREVRRLLTILFRYNQTMEFAIGIGIGVIVAALIGIGKSRRPKQAHIETEEERKRRETDELITVVLPTINHDK